MSAVMDARRRLNAFVNRNRDVLLDLIRIYLGVGLFAKGVYFASHIGVVMGLLNDDFGGVLLAHLIAFAHLCGGVLLAAGLLTRLAAAVQVPILLGAVFGVHLREGLFGPSQNLEFALLVLFLLVLFVIAGGGRLSADSFLARREALLSGRPPPGLSGTA
jgi:uncharacterized membrane protein YphA (DoxX/SURF4 family)